MLKKLNKLEKQHGGAIPFSSLKEQSKTKKKIKRTNKNKRKKRTISPSRQRRKVTKKKKRTKKNTKECNNKMCHCGTHTYTEKEITPNGLGKCSECMPLGVVLKGKDNKLYENSPAGWIKIN